MGSRKPQRRSRRQLRQYTFTTPLVVALIAFVVIMYVWALGVALTPRPLEHHAEHLHDGKAKPYKPRPVRAEAGYQQFDVPAPVGMVAEPAMPSVESLSRGDPITIVYSNGNKKWNTGVWPGWGEFPVAILNWAAAGVRVEKVCPFQCIFTHDNDKLPIADAVIMEVVNHPKFLGIEKGRKTPFPWPPASSAFPGAPLMGSFFFEPASKYPDWAIDKKIQGRMNITMHPDTTSTLPISLVCPWGRPREDIVRPPPMSDKLAHPDRIVTMFNEHGAASTIEPLWRSLEKKLNDRGWLHSYFTYKTRETPKEAGGEPYQLDNRLKFIGTYRFVIIMESYVEKDFIMPEWSQSFLSGTVPIYLGAPNVEDFAPGANSFLRINKESDVDAVIDAIQRSIKDDDYYRRFFDWKEEGMSMSYSRHLDNCAHYAECRLCMRVRDMVEPLRKKKLEQQGKKKRK